LVATFIADSPIVEVKATVSIGSSPRRKAALSAQARTEARDTLSWAKRSRHRLRGRRNPAGAAEWRR
jgi:hypothetical protein